MDKYEYKLKLEQIRNLIEAKDYEAAAQIADSINWKKVKSVATLCMIGELFEKTRRLEESREILLMAYERSPVGRNIIYRLAHVAIKLQSLEEAQEYYEEFLEIAPHDNMRYVLKYEIAKAKGESLEGLISILEEFKEREYTEEWAFELAYLYHKNGQTERCVDVCDELILWFGEGRYVEKALELKMMYQPLNQMQEDKYRRFRQQKEGVVEVSPRDALSSGEIVHETVKIPSILSDTGRFNTLNLQAELAKSMEQIMAATKQETVDHTIDNFKQIADDAAQIEAEELQQNWSGQLPSQEDLRQGWSGQLPNQEQLEQGWSGQLPSQEDLRQGWSGQLPGQDAYEGWPDQQINSQYLQDWQVQMSGAMPEQGWSGQLPNQEDLEQGWSGRLPNQEDLEQGWSGQLPNQEDLEQGWSGQLPNQEDLEQGWSGRLPGQEMYQGYSGQQAGLQDTQGWYNQDAYAGWYNQQLEQQPVQDTAQGWYGQEQQETVQQGWSGQLPNQERYTEQLPAENPTAPGWPGSQAGQEPAQSWPGQQPAENAGKSWPGQQQGQNGTQDWASRWPTQKLQRNDAVQQANWRMQQSGAMPSSNAVQQPDWKMQPNGTVRQPDWEMQPNGAVQQPDWEMQSNGAVRQPDWGMQKDRALQQSRQGIRPNSALNPPSQGLPADNGLNPPSQGLPPGNDLEQSGQGVKKNRIPQQSGQGLQQNGMMPQPAQNPGFGGAAQQVKQVRVAQEGSTQEDAPQPEKTVQSYDLNQLEWPSRIPEEKRMAWLGQSAQPDSVPEESASSESIHAPVTEAGREAPAQDQSLPEEMPDPALDIDFRGILTENPDEEEEQPEAGATGSSVHITGKMSLAEILAAWEKRKAEVEAAAKTMEGGAKAAAAGELEPQTEEEDIEEAKRKTIQQMEQLMEWLKSGGQIFPEEGEAEKQNLPEPNPSDGLQQPEQTRAGEAPGSAVCEEAAAAPEEVHHEAAGASEDIQQEAQDQQQPPNHIFQKQEELEQKILQRQQQVQQVLEREVREEHLLQNEITVEDSGEEDLPLTQLNEEQQQIFTYFTLISGMEQQLCQALEGARHRKRNNRTSNSGNLIITGGKRSGKTMLATDFVKAYQRLSGHPSIKVGKISAEMLNQKDIRVLFQAVEGGYLIVENAGGLSKQSVEKLSALMEGDTKGVMVILEDEKAGINKALARSPEFTKKFTERIHIPIFTSDELVAFAKAYAKEHRCEIEDMGILALYNSISNIQKLDEPTTLTEVKEIMDDAISRASRGGLKKLFGGKRNTENGMILIKEKDFRE